MHTLLVCGAPWCDLPSVQQLLTDIGILQPVPAQSGEVRTIDDWYERLFANPGEAQGVMRVGKAWETAASQIFLSNWAVPAWGWSDSRSTWLLEFWRDFDSRNCFILLYIPARRALAQALADCSDVSFDAQRVLDEWVRYHVELLRFYNRNPQRCVFLDIDQVLARPMDFATALNQQFSLNLQLPEHIPAQAISESQLDQWLAQQYLQAYPAATEVEQELIASVPGLSLGGEQLKLPNVQNAAMHLREFYRDWTATKAANAAMVEQLDTERGRNAVLMDFQMQQHQQAQQELLAQHQEYRRTQQHEHRQQQLHLEQQIQILRQELGAMAEQFDAEQTRHSQLLERQSQQQEKELQLHQQIQKLHLEFDQQKEVWRADMVSQSDELDDVVLQLHSAQEGLELQLDRNGELQGQLQRDEQRWARLYVLNPQCIEWRRIERLAQDGFRPSWLVQGLVTADGPWPPLVVSLKLDAQVSAIVVEAQRVGSEASNGWCSIPGPLVVMPHASRGSVEDQVLRRLSARDFNLLRGVCVLLSRDLPSHSNSCNEYQSTFAGMLAVLDQRPELRFNAVHLQSEQVLSDYEHLDIILDQARFGARAWPRFEFRLAAARVCAGSFSVLPRLQFPAPQEGDKQFAGWMVESEDELGPRFEWRFDTGNKAVDVAAWNALSRRDQLQMLSLIMRLPEMLQALADDGVRIARPWTDWIDLSQDILSTLRMLEIPLKAEDCL